MFAAGHSCPVADKSYVVDDFDLFASITVRVVTRFSADVEDCKKFFAWSNANRVCVLYAFTCLLVAAIIDRHEYVKANAAQGTKKLVPTYFFFHNGREAASRNKRIRK